MRVLIAEDDIVTVLMLQHCLEQFGYDVTIVDPRTAFASPERFPDVEVIAAWPDVALPPLGVDRYTAFVALTHDPKIDDPALLHALGRDCFYIGALGSRRTHALLAWRRRLVPSDHECPPRFLGFAELRIAGY